MNNQNVTKAHHMYNLKKDTHTAYVYAAHLQFTRRTNMPTVYTYMAALH